MAKFTVRGGTAVRGDAALRGGAGQTLDHTFDAVAHSEQLLDHTFDAIGHIAGLKDHTFDAVARAVVTKDHTFDAVARTTAVKDHAFDAIAHIEQILDHTFDAITKLSGALVVIDHTFDAMLVKVHELSMSADINIGVTESPTVDTAQIVGQGVVKGAGGATGPDQGLAPFRAKIYHPDRKIIRGDQL